MRLSNVLRLSSVAVLLCLNTPNSKATQILNVAIETAGQYELHMWVPFGSTVDTVPGIAHVLEHLKFKSGGDKGIGGLDKIVGSGSNAATTYRFTRYDVGISADHLQDALIALAGVTEPLKIKDVDLDGQKNVVKQELLQRYKGDPDTPFFLDYAARVYAGTPLAVMPGGTTDTVDQVKMDDVLKFDAAHYQGADRFLVIAGPALSTAMKNDLLKLFPSAHIGSVNVNTKRIASHDDADLRVQPVFLPAPDQITITPSHFRMDGTSSHISTTKLVYTKLISAPLTWNQILAGDILEKAVQSRLSEGLIDVIAEDAGLVQNFTFSVDATSQRVLKMEFSADMVDGVAPEKVVRVFETYFAALSKNGVSGKSFARLRDRFFLHDEWDDVESRISILGQTAVQYGYTKAADEYDNFHALKVEDVNALLKNLGADGRVGVAVLQPQSKLGVAALQPEGKVQ